MSASGSASTQQLDRRVILAAAGLGQFHQVTRGVVQRRGIERQRQLDRRRIQMLVGAIGGQQIDPPTAAGQRW